MSGVPSYCPPIILETNGRKQLFIWDTQSLSSLDSKTGDVAWSVTLPPGFGVSTAVARPIGDNIFVTATGNISALINASTGDTVWKGTPTTSMGCSISTPIVEDEIIYGVDPGAGALIAARASDGERIWKTVTPIDAESSRPRGPSNGTAFIVKNGDRYFFFNDSGDLILASLSAKGYQGIGRFHVLEATNNTGPRNVVWSHPACAQKYLFARNDKELVCVSLASK